VIAFESRFHVLREMTAGSNVELNIHAHNIPKLIVIPYPIRGSIGDVVIDKNADTVVMLVRKMGISSESIVPDMEVI
jgi:hypothetical protein